MTDITARELETLAALRLLDQFAIEFNLSTNLKTLEVPPGKTVSEVLIALANALRENGIKANGD
jgi:hypothetical protein